MTLTTLPEPTWHGFPAWTDMVRQWGEFVTNREIERVKKAPEKTRNDLRQAQDQIDYWRTEVPSVRQRVKEYQATLDALRVQLTDPDPEALVQQAAEIRTLPFVLGTRFEPTGEMAVLIRVTGEWNGQPVDIGDFDVALRANRTTTSVIYLRAARFAKGDSLSYSYLTGYRGVDDFSGISGGVTGHIRGIGLSGRSPAEYLQEVHDRLIQTTAGYSEFRETQPALDPLWSSFLSDDEMVSALRANHHFSQADLRNSIESAESRLESAEADLRHHQENLREWNFKLRRAQAAHEAAVAQSESGTVTIDNQSVQQWVDDLKKIATFPGVMGLKFNDSGIPVIHVRTSIVHQDTRYDMGDYELTLKSYSNHSSYAVITTQATRDVENWYYSSGYDNEPSTFCYGSRSTQIWDLFQANEYPAMVHMLINCLNSVNSGSESEISNSFNEIPKDAVWQNELREGEDQEANAPKNFAIVTVTEVHEEAPVVTLTLPLPDPEPQPEPHSEQRPRRERPRRRPRVRQLLSA